jgi:hypothetical protein
MTKHVHKWRKIAESVGLSTPNWYCTYLDCGRKAVWCCGEKSVLTYPRACYAGRCAEHGPKPRKPKKLPEVRR